MKSKVLDHLKQTKGYASKQEQAFLMMIRIAENFLYELDQLLKEYGLTQTQYNALRILRGAGESGLPCNEIGSRMIKRVPDVTRLLDRLEKLGFVTRKRQDDNRRVVIATITQAGIELANKIDKPIENHVKYCFEPMEDHNLDQFIEMMDTLNSDKDPSR